MTQLEELKRRKALEKQLRDEEDRQVASHRDSTRPTEEHWDARSLELRNLNRKVRFTCKHIVN